MCFYRVIQTYKYRGVNKVYSGKNKGVKRSRDYFSMIQCVHKPFSDLSLPSPGLCLLTCPF